MKYNPNLYVPRTEIEDAFKDFAEGDDVVFVMLGEPGCGKTYLFCHFAETYSKRGHLVLLYEGTELPHLDMERIVVEDLGLVAYRNKLFLYPDFREAMKNISELASQEKSLAMILIDAVDQSMNYVVLLKNISKMIDKIDFPNVKIAFNSRTEPWNRAYEQCNYAQKKIRSCPVKEFSTAELKKAYSIYMHHYGFKTDLESISPKIRDIIRHPVMLDAISRVYANKSIPSEVVIPANLEKFYEELDQRNDTIFDLQRDIEKIKEKMEKWERQERGRFCALTGGLCLMSVEEEPASCFVGFTYSPYFDEVVDSVIKPVLLEFGIKPKVAKEEYYGGNILCNICQLAQSSSFGIMDISLLNPNVMLELGLILGLNKKVVLTISKVHQGELAAPSDLAGFYRVEYENYEELRVKLRTVLKKYILE